LLGIGQHLHFAIEVVGQHGREDKYLVTGLTAGWDIVHLGLRLQFCKDTFLGTTAIVIGQQFSGMDTFVGDNHLEVVAVFIRNKQIQLDGLLVLFAVACADKDKALLRAPAFGFPARLKKIATIIELTPAPTAFNHTLECYRSSLNAPSHRTRPAQRRYWFNRQQLGLLTQSKIRL